MYVICSPYILFAIIVIVSIVAARRDLISTTQFKIMTVGAGAFALTWSALLCAVWLAVMLEYR